MTSQLNTNDINLLNRVMVQVEAMRLTDAEISFLNTVYQKPDPSYDISEETAFMLDRKVLIKRVRTTGQGKGSLYALDEIATAKGWDIGQSSKPASSVEKPQGFLHIHAGGL